MALKFASSINIIAIDAGSVASSTERAVRGRLPFYIGSGDLSNIVLSFQGFRVATASAPNYANAYSIVKVAIEKNGATSSVPVYFGGVRNKTINPGDVDIQSDAVLPSSFSLSTFARDDLYWLRFEYSVVNATDILPGGNHHHDNYGSYTDTISVRIDTGVYTGGDVDSYGALSLAGSGWSDFGVPMVPFVLGTHVSAAAAKKTFILIGDSITSGIAADTASLKGFRGMTRGLANTDRTTGHYGGANFGIGGSDATLWAGASGAKLTPFLAYAGYAFEEMGVNMYTSAPGPSAASVIADCRVIWDACIAASVDVLRLKMLPYTTSDGVTAIHSGFQSGGNARAFNIALSSESGITVVARNSLRVGSTENTDNFYQWAGTTTNQGDGLHPNAAGTLLDAIDLRAIIAALPDASSPTVSTVTSSGATEAGNMVFTVSLSGTTSGSTNYAFSVGGTATAGVDFTSPLTSAMCSNSVTVSGGNFVAPNGVSGWSVTVPTLTDTADEDAETIVLTIGGTASTGGTITDDDAAPVITASDATQSGGTVTFTLTLTPASGKSVTCLASTANGAKTAGTHFTGITDQLVTFTPGQTSQTVAVTVL